MDAEYSWFWKLDIVDQLLVGVANGSDTITATVNVLCYGTGL